MTEYIVLSELPYGVALVTPHSLTFPHIPLRCMLG
ncbi:hypothetical protein Barb4_02733 [Bacteroidales bacterium Barb4]|nr:hypothetical protein Barb4_02733 [Bacteroidales bacterium Barb4]